MIEMNAETLARVDWNSDESIVRAADPSAYIQWLELKGKWRLKVGRATYSGTDAAYLWQLARGRTDIAAFERRHNPKFRGSTGLRFEDFIAASFPDLAKGCVSQDPECLEISAIARACWNAATDTRAEQAEVTLAAERDASAATIKELHDSLSAECARNAQTIREYQATIREYQATGLRIGTECDALRAALDTACQTAKAAHDAPWPSPEGVPEVPR